MCSVRLAVLSVSLLLASCAAPRPGADGRALSPAEARGAVREWIFDWKPTMNRNQEFPLVDLTTPEIRSQLGLQVFQIHRSQQILGCSTFVIHRGRATPIGAGLGGHGVMSLLVTDLEDDGRPELTYSYSFGSGIHRCQFAQWRPDEEGDSGRELVAQTSYTSGDVRLVAADDGVALWLAPFDPDRGWGEPERHLGRLALTESGVLDVEQAADLPPPLRNQFWTR